MNNFDFHNPTRIVFGQGRIQELDRLVPAEARVLVLTGGGSVRRNGTLAEALAALGGRTVLEFSGIEPNPTYETLMEAVALARRERVDFLLAVGGGSVIDGTKFVAAAIPFQGDTTDEKFRASVFDSISRKYGPVTLCVPAAGITRGD